MKSRINKMFLCVGGVGMFMVIALVLVVYGWDVRLTPMFFAGALLGVSFAILGIGVACWLQFRMSRDNQPERVDFAPEPLLSREMLYQTDASNPLNDWLLHDLYQVPDELSVNKCGAFKFVTVAETADEWDYIYLDPGRFRWKDYSWKCRIKRDTPFREFAFNFRYQDFDNRYRYRFEDDKIFFDKKVKGIWFNNIASCPFAMELGKCYDLRIDVYASLFRCYVDSHFRMENTDVDLGWGSICVILWEDDGKTDIKAEVGPMCVHAISSGQVANS